MQMFDKHGDYRWEGEDDQCDQIGFFERSQL